MWTGSSLRRQQTEEERPRWPMHNVDEAGRSFQPASSPTDVQVTGLGSTAESQSPEGLWGERDVGGPVDQRAAMEEYETLRKQLTELSKTRSGGVPLQRTGTGLSKIRSRQSRGSMSSGPAETDIEAGKDGEDDGDSFELDQFMREGHFEKRKDGRSTKKVGVVFKHLTVKGVGSNSKFVKTLPHAVMGTFGPDLYRIITHFLPALAFSSHKQTRILINDFSGIVRDGEMLLILGKPGSGCSTFLKAIANKREEFAKVSGEVTYGGIPADRQKKRYRGEVNYNPEDDIHFPDLNVWQTFQFALMNKTKKREKGDIPVIINALMKMFGISHTKYTKVGNEYVRGISGGERKRVSIAETLATKSTVLCWDNSTRGLDASTALDYARSLRIMTDVSDRTTFVTLYQAGEQIYEVMDKVIVIDQGRCIYQGPAKNAKQYFIDLGFHCPERQTTADFLTACTDPNERQFRDGYELKAPKTSEELETAFRNSPEYQHVLDDIASYENHLLQTGNAETKEFEQAVQEQKSHRTVSKSSSYTVSFSRQVWACAKREFWLVWGDKTTLYTKYFIIVSNGLIVGSLFYGESLGTEGAFSRGGAMFFSILFLGWLQLTELMKAVTGRDVVARHHEYAFYRPSAVTMARILVDFPILLPQVIIFTLIMYFMTGLDLVASKFWILLLFVYLSTILLTSLYRMFASLSPTIDDAVRFSGISLNVLIFFTGYVIPKPQMLTQVIWFGWVYYINPLAYVFEAVLTNEFSGRTMDCSPLQLVPSGPGVQTAYQGCSQPGATVNAKSVSGDEYLGTTFEYRRSNLWRNFAVAIAFCVLYILITVFATENFSFTKGGGGALEFKKTRRAKKSVKSNPPADAEKAGEAGDSSASSDQTQIEPSDNKEDALEDISGSDSVFTWEEVSYSIPYQGGERQLLNKIDGYVKPGVMIALMGASGAGKTTLLNTLAQRQSFGVVSGNMNVDGRDLGIEFQRGTGFCEQMDLHDGSATIREALEFSAILRQDRETPRSEKIAYVDKIIDLLELDEIQDAIVSSLGVEQCKRLTIGVELAAKPSLLLFLDEPTSGLDSQSAYSIVRFLKKLSRAGQAIICTIHQPSSVLIQQFDMILALNPGGNCFYFGPVGENGNEVVDYFAQRGFQCPKGKNVAEFILETAAKPRRRPDGTKVDWNKEWRDSDNAKLLKDEIKQLKDERSKTPPPKEDIKRAFAAPILLQTTELTKRLLVQYWRDPSYLYGKLFTAVTIAIFNGFTFYKIGNSTQDMQDRMFSAFLVLTIPPTIVNAVVPKFFQNMMLWMAREHPSRIYGWEAFTTAQVIGEIPMAIVQSVLYFVLWYFPTGLPTESGVSGYVFFMTLLFFLFMSSWGQWITAFAPSFTVISNVLPFFFVMFSLFNGVIRQYSLLPAFWRYWMYWINPSTWWINGVLGKTLSGIPVRCTPQETAQFNPPPNMSCQQYAGDYAKAAGGYLLDPSSTDVCQYCMYSVGDDYLKTLNINPNDAWRDCGIFIVFVISNWALVYFFIYTVRIKGWSFGFGYVFRQLGRLVDLAKKPFSKLGNKEGENEKEADADHSEQ